MALEIFWSTVLPFILQFLIVLPSALATPVPVTNLITEVNVVAAAAVLVIVRFLLVPALPALSPSIVTLSAPLSSINPRPLTVEPEIVTASAVGRIEMEV